MDVVGFLEAVWETIDFTTFIIGTYICGLATGCVVSGIIIILKARRELYNISNQRFEMEQVAQHLAITLLKQNGGIRDVRTSRESTSAFKRDKVQGL